MSYLDFSITKAQINLHFIGGQGKKSFGLAGHVSMPSPSFVALCHYAKVCNSDRKFERLLADILLMLLNTILVLYD